MASPLSLSPPTLSFSTASRSLRKSKSKSNSSILLSHRSLISPPLISLGSPASSSRLATAAMDASGSSQPASDSELFIDTGSSGLPERSSETLDSSAQEVSSAVQQQRVVIQNSYGEKLVGILQEAGSQELVILCHGFRSSKESKTINILSEALVSANISVFCFDFAGNGDSEGSFHYGNYWREVEDLRAVTNFFSSKRYKVCAIVGHSKGGNVVLLYASKFRDVTVVVNVSGRFNLQQGIGERLGGDFMEELKTDGFIDVKDKVGNIIYRVTEESVMDRLNTNMNAACFSIDQNCRVLTIHGSADDVVPPENALEFDKLIANHKLHIIDGADHRFLTHQTDLTRSLLEFIQSSNVKEAHS